MVKASRNLYWRCFYFIHHLFVVYRQSPAEYAKPDESKPIGVFF